MAMDASSTQSVNILETFYEYNNNNDNNNCNNNNSNNDNDNDNNNDSCGIRRLKAPSNTLWVTLPDCLFSRTLQPRSFTIYNKEQYDTQVPRDQNK